MIDVQFQPPDPYGLDWADPGQVANYQESQNEAIRQAFEEVRSKGNNPKYIKVVGLSPKELVAAVAPWPGELKFFDGTLAQATSWGKKYGWAVCDGTQGTPDLRDTFIRGASATEDAGGTGGADTHTHVFTGTGHTHPLDNAVIEAVADHTHALDGTSGAGSAHTHTSAGTIGAPDSSGNFCVCGATPNAGTNIHTHVFTGGTSSSESSHTHAVAFATEADGGHTPDLLDQDTDSAPACGTTDAGSTLPTYYEVIILRKTEWNVAA